MEDTIALSSIHMPNELSIDKRCCWAHHAVNPLRVKEGLVDIGRLVVPLPLHVKIVGSLHWDRAISADFLVADGNGETDLARHGSTADDCVLEAELLDSCGDEADVGVFGVGVMACLLLAESLCAKT